MSGEYPNSLYQTSLRVDIVSKHEEMADLCDSQRWSELIEMLKHDKGMVNCCRLPTEGGPPPKLFTPLHQAANQSATENVFEELLSLGASKTLKTADGETAYDIGKRVGLSQKILDLIKVPSEITQDAQSIQKLQDGLHKTILGRAERLVKEHGLQLPQVAYLYEFGGFWYPIPGMYGGFDIQKHEDGIQTESWCRVAGGSGQRHVINRQGEVKMTDEGFV